MNELKTTTRTTPITPSDLIAIERVERDAWLDLYSAAPRPYATAQGMTFARWESIGLLACKELPIAEFNRALSIGVEGGIGEAQLDEALHWLREHGSPDAVLQCPTIVQTSALDTWLQRRGLARRGNGWAKLKRMVAPASVTDATDIEVCRVTPDTAQQFGNVVQAGFGLPAHCASWFAALAGRPGWQLYLAYHGDLPIASGALFVADQWGWMGIDATLPDYRRRGAQTALISRRAADGARAGLLGLTAETGQPAPGQEAAHTSYSNYLRQGFERMYVRDNYR